MNSILLRIMSDCLALKKEPDENLEAKFIAAKTMERRLSQRKLKSYIELVLEE